jgi:phage gp36-like protein
MAFISKADFGTAIKTNILDDITEADDNKITISISKAIELMKGYLSARYNITQIFNKEDDARNILIVERGVDIALYMLHKRLNPRKIPEHRKEAYKEAKEWLEQVQALNINPPDLPLVADGTKDYIQYGGETRRNNRLQ